MEKILGLYSPREQSESQLLLSDFEMSGKDNGERDKDNEYKKR